MKSRDYPETDSLYTEIKSEPGVAVREIVDGLNVDLGAAREVVGVDIDHASCRFNALYQSTLPSTGMRAGLVWRLRAKSSTGMRAGLVWRLRAKSKTYQPTDRLSTRQWFGRLVLSVVKVVEPDTAAASERVSGNRTTIGIGSMLAAIGRDFQGVAFDITRERPNTVTSVADPADSDRSVCGHACAYRRRWRQIGAEADRDIMRRQPIRDTVRQP